MKLTRVLTAAAVLPLAAAGLVLGSGAATADAAQPSPTRAPASAAVSLANTVKLDNCSGALVRFPTSQDGDRAMLLTNGHCYERGFIPSGRVLTQVPSSRSGYVLSASGRSVARVQADRLVYGTMTGTDIALYTLTSTYRALKSVGAQPMTIAKQRPQDGTAMSIPSSYWSKTYSCSINGFVGTLREGEWEWTDSIRYNAGCRTIHGTSGSPIVDNVSGEIIGINNTGNDDGQRCTDNNPCEVGDDGSVQVHQGQSYGQQTYWITTCVNGERKLDLRVAGCRLPKA